jgi:histidine triad (HIT) family protein
MGKDCIFCSIVAGEIPVKLLFEDESTVAFADINPQAPVHLLIIPKAHLASLAHAAAADANLLGTLMAAAAKIAEDQGLATGYRIVVNTGPDGGQTVDHLHLHLLGGRPMAWPPG